MPRILLEDNHGPFILDPTKIVTESVGNVDFTRIPGRLSTIGVINGNKRRYGRSVWEKNLAEGSVLRTLMGRNATFGLLEHPASGEIDLNSPIAVVLIEAKLENDDVVGAFRILNTAEGNKLKALIEAGFNPTVSSRGFGSLAKGADGIDEVQDDYVCEGWDVVLKPSFQNAVLEIPTTVEGTKPKDVKESTLFIGSLETEKGILIHSTPLATAAEAQSWVESLSENFTGQKVKTHIRKTDGTLLESLPAKAAPAAPAPLSAPVKPVVESVKNTQQEKHTVDIKTIKNQIAEMRQTVPSKLTPQRFSEGMSRLSELHQTVADYASENPKSSWDASQLHQSISEIETAWNVTAAAPSKEVARLRESFTKLMKVTKALAEVALSHRNAAAKAVGTLAKTQESLKETVKRGRVWVERAKKAENIAENTEYKVVCEALKKLATKHKALSEEYNADVTELGRTTLQLEFADKLKADAALSQQLDEAKTIDDIVACREAITGIKEEDTIEDDATKDNANAKPEDKKGEKASVTEKKKLPAFMKKEKKKDDKHEDEKGEKGEPKMAKKNESVVPPAPKAPGSAPLTFINVVRNPQDVNESIDMVNRLSKSTQLVG